VQVIAGQVSGTLFNVESARLVELETKVRWRLAASSCVLLQGCQ
jgi:hypothetical protein